MTLRRIRGVTLSVRPRLINRINSDTVFSPAPWMISCSSTHTQSPLPCLLGCAETQEFPYKLLHVTHVQACLLGFCAAKPWLDMHRECCTALMCSAPLHSYMGKKELRISQQHQCQLCAAQEIPKSLQPSAVCLYLPKEESTEG